MWCSDPWVEHMKGYGYYVVRLPKANMKPLLMLISQGNILVELALSTRLEKADVPLPEIQRRFDLRPPSFGGA